MDLLQYSFTLEPDYPMEAVRERVAAKRHLFDLLAGLRWKAWLLSQPLPGRSQAKSYAPLYLFEDTQAAHAFLCGDIYKGVTDAFGWTAPFHGRAINTPRASLAAAASCSLQTRPLRDHASLKAAARTAAAPDGALLQACLLDISRMQLRTYTFWTCAAHALAHVEAEVAYEVVAVSCPARERS
jgi:hypothetical protein